MQVESCDRDRSDGTTREESLDLLASTRRQARDRSMECQQIHGSIDTLTLNI